MQTTRFALKEKVLLIQGAKRGAIYNLYDGSVYSIDEKSLQLLRACEDGVELGIYFVQHPSIEVDRSLVYLQKLCDAGLGNFIGQDDKVEKISFAPINYGLNFLWLEVTTGCNLKCVHCYAGSSPSLIGQDRMSQKDWASVMRQAIALDYRKVQFIGGEPFVLGHKLIELIQTANELGFKFIEVFTNATLLRDDTLNALQQCGVHVAVSFYSEDRDVHESITLGANSHANTVRNIQRILASGLDLRVVIICMRHNQDSLIATEQYIRKLGVRNISVDYIRPSGRGSNHNLVPDKYADKMSLEKPTFHKCTENVFRQRLFGHNCFSKEACVTASGDVFPCIMERDTPYGNVLEESLEVILNKTSTKAIRGLSKDYIETCHDCEYRYACLDCRTKAKNADSASSLYAKPKSCLYNPYTGIWDRHQ
jgi:radical SAM protein with 4Fe4S-binding SPASM domain